MATTVTINSNYAGEAGAILRQSFNELDAINKGLVTLAPNVRYKLSLRKVRTTNGKTNYTCGHTPTGAVTLSEKVMILKDIKDDFEVCKRDFKVTWDGLDSEMLDAVLASRLDGVIEELGQEIWNGNAATDGEVGGFIPQFIADADVLKANSGLTPTGISFSKSNVLAEFEKVANAVPVAIRTKADIKFIVSPDVAEYYMQYLVANGILAGFGGAGMEMQYGRYIIVQDAGLPNNTVIVARQSNLIVAMDSEAAINEVSVVDEDEFGRLTGNIIGKIAYSSATGYYNSAEIVYYLSTTTPA
tara:strand:- start:14620 stop:15522 length:903 start_codon:yes stop_codon:yes gene_type:complete